jgi:hypothetical protein
LQAWSAPSVQEAARGDSSCSAAASALPHLGGNAPDLVDVGEASPAVAGNPGQRGPTGARAPVGQRDTGDQAPVSEPRRIQNGSPEGTGSPHGRSPSVMKRARTSARRHLTAAVAFTRRGLTPTVIVLAVLAVGPFVYGWLHRPDTSVPQPLTSHVEIDLSPRHPLLSPITVGISLSGRGGAATVYIDLAGGEFTQTGWSVSALVPAGVEPDGAQVVSPASQGMDEVSFAPGPQRDGKYTAQLNWYNLTSGPLQVTGANLMAVFPDVTVVTNQSDLVTPTLLVTVTQELDPGSDFAYLGGPPPDHFAGTRWVWKPVTGYATGTVLTSPLDAEARSAALDGQAQTAQFYSGVAFGVAASAFIAAVAEFVNKGRRERDAASKPTGQAKRRRRWWPSRHPPGEPQTMQRVDTDAGHRSPDGGQTSGGAPAP